MLPESAQRLVEVPVGAEDVGAEVADQGVLVRGRDEGHVVQPVADALPAVGGEDRADREGRAAVPARAGPVDVPTAVHAEVRAQGAVVGQADEQVLAAGDHLAHVDTGEVDGGQLRHPQFAAAQRRAGQRGVHPLARPARRCLLRARRP